MPARTRIPRILWLLAVLAACGGGDKDAATPATNPSAAAPAAGAPRQPKEGGKVITVELLTDEKGNNMFRPNAIDANEGDVLRFTLVNGVHNVHFPADSNTKARNLPPASDLLQLPGQTYDVLLDWEEGKYFFQCDPHALLGMVGRLTIRDKD